MGFIHVRPRDALGRMAQALIVECYISDEMIAAGMEAKREAETLCLTEGEIVREIYYAMYGQGIKCAAFGEESLH